MQVRTTDIFGLVEEELQKHVSGSPGGKKLPVILAIDGRCGSGKTTLAGMIAHRYKAEVIHMDDFLLRQEQRTPERLAEQQKRILTRNGPEMLPRFISEWIPKEELYFKTFRIKEKCSICLTEIPHFPFM